MEVSCDRKCSKGRMNEGLYRWISQRLARSLPFLRKDLSLNLQLKATFPERDMLIHIAGCWFYKRITLLAGLGICSSIVGFKRAAQEGPQRGLIQAARVLERFRQGLLQRGEVRDPKKWTSTTSSPNKPDQRVDFTLRSLNEDSG